MGSFDAIKTAVTSPLDGGSRDFAEVDLSFWDLNPREHLWSRLKALQLYDKANIFIMLYNAEDRDSFDRLGSIYNDFKESNQVGAYCILVSVISADIIKKNIVKEIKKNEAEDFI